MTCPYMTTPYMTSPYMTSPYMTCPYMTSPYMTSPYMNHMDAATCQFSSHLAESKNLTVLACNLWSHRIVTLWNNWLVKRDEIF